MFPIPYSYYTPLGGKSKPGLADEECHDGVDYAQNQTRAEGAPEVHFYAGQKIDREDNHRSVDNKRRNPHS